jgi:hypothetical protein
MTTRDVFKSVPAEGAIERDWTNETITLDLVNGDGENFHFEIPPHDPQKVTISSGGDTSYGGKCQLDIILPIES